MSLDSMRVTGGSRLSGEVPIAGAKNAALPLLAATLLTKEECVLRNLPALHDIDTMIEILKVLGVSSSRKERVVQVSAESLSGDEAPYSFVRKMRASVLLLGPLLARHGFARVSLPGGCAIGVRPIDLHLKAFEALGAEIHLADGYVEARAGRLKGVEHTFPLVTVTGTANAMMAASLAEGVSVFRNCAREPEVGAVAEALRRMGCAVHGDGTPTITVPGCRELRGFDLTLLPDRIETGTYLTAAAITGGDLYLRGAHLSDLEAVVAKLREAGTSIEADKEGLRARGAFPIRPVNIETAPHPGFPTDMQAQLMALLTLADGVSEVTETIFENRFMHVAELLRMGADLHVAGSKVTVRGVKSLHGAPVMATDLRASASLILAGLAAEGVTEVLRIYHLDRGYESMERKLAAVGAKIERVPERAGAAVPK